MRGFLWRKCLARIFESDAPGFLQKIVLGRCKHYFFKRKASKILGRGQATIKLKRPNAIANVIYTGGFRSSVMQSQPILLRWYAGGCNIYACDIPNHGLSVPDESRRGYIESFDACINVALAMILATLWSRSRRNIPVVLMGHSFGALIMLGLLLHYPFLQKYVAGVICCATPLRVDHNVAEHLRRWQKALARADMLLKFFEKWRRWAVHIPGPEEFAEDDLDDPLLYKGPLYAHTAIVINNAANFVREHIDSVRVPVLFVHGARDEVAPVRYVDDAVALMGERAKLFLYAEGNHDILRDVTSIHDEILSWIRECVGIQEKTR